MFHLLHFAERLLNLKLTIMNTKKIWEEFALELTRGKEEISIRNTRDRGVIWYGL